MKKTISSILISSLLLLATIGCWNRVDAQCFAVLRQYYECQNLKMVKINDPRLGPYYRPDPHASSHNVLDDSFYQKLGLASMNSNEAMNLIKKIYQETSIGSCESETCKCVVQRYMAWTNQYHDPMAILFRAENFEQTKEIIEALDQSLADQRHPSAQLQMSSVFGGGQNLSTLSEFCIRNEYSEMRLAEYKNPWACFKLDEKVSLSCIWSSRVANRAVIMNATNDEMANQMVCELLVVRACSREMQRFYAMQTWANKFARMNVNGGGDSGGMCELFDSLTDRAKSFQAELAYHSTALIIYPDMYKVRSFRHGVDEFKSARSSLVLVESSEFQVSARVELMEKSMRYFHSVEITSGGVSVRLDERMLANQQAHNGVIIKNEKGENALQLVVNVRFAGIDVFDFNTNSIISYSRGLVQLMCPSDLLAKSSGILVDGPDN